MQQILRRKQLLSEDSDSTEGSFLDFKHGKLMNHSDLKRHAKDKRYDSPPSWEVNPLFTRVKNHIKICQARLQLKVLEKTAPKDDICSRVMTWHSA